MQDPNCRWDPFPKLGTSKVRPETQNQKPGNLTIHGIRDRKHKTMKIGSRTLVIGEIPDPKQTYRTWEARSMIPVNSIKCLEIGSE